MNARTLVDAPRGVRRYRLIPKCAKRGDVRTRWIAVAIVVVPLTLFAALTLVALEGREVVVLRTTDENGGVRQTRTWVADAEGVVWIEAANPARAFLRDLQAHPGVAMRRAGVEHRCRGVAMPNPEGHQHIRALLAQKYGWADCWIGFLTDTSGSLAVRLECG